MKTEKLFDKKLFSGNGDGLIKDLVHLINQVCAEDERQKNKWGNQLHNILEWKSIVDEEVGEFDKEVCDYYFGNGANKDKMMNELLQVITLYMKIFIMLDSNWMEPSVGDNQLPPGLSLGVTL